MTIERFPPNSRYNGVATAELTGPDGEKIVYLRRRFIPDPATLVLSAKSRFRAVTASTGWPRPISATRSSTGASPTAMAPRCRAILNTPATRCA